jgi:hypothetical protein
MSRLNDENWESAQWVSEPDAPKQYRLWLSHDEIHMLHWAVRVAEAALVHDLEDTSESMLMYEVQRQGAAELKIPPTMPEVAFKKFVDKFDKMHSLARADDGEGQSNG